MRYRGPRRRLPGECLRIAQQTGVGRLVSGDFLGRDDRRGVVALELRPRLDEGIAQFAGRQPFRIVEIQTGPAGGGLLRRFPRAIRTDSEPPCGIAFEDQPGDDAGRPHRIENLYGQDVFAGTQDFGHRKARATAATFGGRAQFLAVEPIGAPVIDHDPKHGLLRALGQLERLAEVTNRAIERGRRRIGIPDPAGAAVLGLGVAHGQRAGQQEQQGQISRPAWPLPFQTYRAVLIFNEHLDCPLLPSPAPAARRRWRLFGGPFRAERPAPRT